MGEFSLGKIFVGENYRGRIIGGELLGENYRGEFSRESFWGRMFVDSEK